MICMHLPGLQGRHTEFSQGQGVVDRPLNSSTGQAETWFFFFFLTQRFFKGHLGQKAEEFSASPVNTTEIAYFRDSPFSKVMFLKVLSLYFHLSKTVSLMLKTPFNIFYAHYLPNEKTERQEKRFLVPYPASRDIFLL